MKEVIEFDPQSREQVLSMMVAFPEAMCYLFRQMYQHVHESALGQKFFGIYGDPDESYEVKLTEGFIVPES